MKTPDLKTNYISIFSILIAILLSHSLFAQHPTCNGTRYITDEFSNYTTTLGVAFGNNTTIGGSYQDLFMDIYEPAGDLATARPAIILAFGGQFMGGQRSDMDALCQFYARRGFVAVSIDYRLYDFFALPDSNQIIDALIKGTSDMKAAIRFLKEDAATNNSYGIDPNLIFVGGVGAGAMIADHVAYLDSTDVISPNIASAVTANGSWTGNSSSNTQYGHYVAGVINFSGALMDTTYISMNESPLFSAHDDGDGLIPFNDGLFAIDLGFSLTYLLSVQGSELMHLKANMQGIDNELITIPSSTGHVSYFGANAPTYQDSIRNASCFFLEEIICQTPPNTFSTITETACVLYTSPSGNYTWTSSNTYTDTIPNAAGTDSIITVNLTINTVSDLTTSVAGVTISANNTAGTSYQWIDCSDNSTLLGETNIDFMAMANGDYAVIIEENGCTDTSACVSIASVSVQENLSIEFELFPNPTTGMIQISANGQIQHVSIFTAAGELIQSTSPFSSMVKIDVSKSPSGVYFVRLTSNDYTSVEKFFKE